VQLQLINDLAAQAAPTTDADGVQTDPNVEQALFMLKSTAGTGVLTAKIKIWLYSRVPAIWMPLGTATADADRGVLNEGNLIGEVVSDTLQHCELIVGLKHADRIYAEIVGALGGAGTKVSAWLTSRD
jgi:hypothetical protein